MVGHLKIYLFYYNQKDPRKSQTCFAYTDPYENIISTIKCDKPEFCSGTCSKRYCSIYEYNWLDQAKCRNNYNPDAITNSTDIIPIPEPDSKCSIYDNNK